LNSAVPYISIARGSPLSAAQAGDLIAVLKEKQPERRLRVEMALVGRALVPGLRSRKIEVHSLAEPIGLAKVEGRVCVPLLRKGTPDCHSGGIIGLLPRIDAGFHRLRREMRICGAKQYESN
jgi:hypothetical protein